MSTSTAKLAEVVALLEARVEELERNSNDAVLKRARQARDSRIAGNRSEHFSAIAKARWAKRTVTADAV